MEEMEDLKYEDIGEKKATDNPTELDSELGVLICEENDIGPDYEVGQAEIVSEGSAFEKRRVIATWNFKTWSPSSLHWYAASHTTIYNNGDVYTYATRIANHRTHGLFRVGYPYDWYVDIFCLDADKRVLNLSGHLLGGLRFNHSSNQIRRTTVNTYVRDRLSEVRWLRPRRRIQRSPGY